MKSFVKVIFVLVGFLYIISSCTEGGALNKRKQPPETKYERLTKLKKREIEENTVLLSDEDRAYLERIEEEIRSEEERKIEREAKEKERQAKRDAELAAKSEEKRKLGSFSVWQQDDEMTGEVKHFMSSYRVESIEPMDFPYRGTTAWVGAGCSAKTKKIWSYVGFSASPNLTNDETHSGYNSVVTRVNLDGGLDTVTFVQTWGDKFLVARYNNDFLRKLSAHKKMIIELRWHGNDRTKFRFNLAGSTYALNKLKKSCGIK